MKNVFDIRYEKNLTFIIPTEYQVNNAVKYDKVAVIIYLYYADTLSRYFKYIDQLPLGIHLYIISSQQIVIEKMREYLQEKNKTNVVCIKKPNVGRDISALLVEGKKIVNQYQYVCFLHDKKEHCLDTKEETELWIENIWGNLIGNEKQIVQILNIMEENENIGVLAPPDPIGDHFSTWYGFGWHGSYEITKQIATELNLNADIDRTKPPITIGTALWFKSDALKKLFERSWEYDDFEDSKLEDANYLSYGIERIFAYVAQDKGYDTGEVMTLKYAKKQNSFLQHAMSNIFYEIEPFFPLQTNAAIEQYKKRLPALLAYTQEKSKVFLYGAGDMGKFFLMVLRRNSIIPEGFVVSQKPKMRYIDGAMIYSVEDIKFLLDESVGIVITVAKEEVRLEIKSNLEKIGYHSFFEFWIR